MAQKIAAPRGTKDILPAEIPRWHAVERTARETARRYGFEEIRFPAFEHTELFLRGVGDTTDIVQKEMYTFEDKGGRSITLRPEGTASVVRAAVEHSLLQQGLPLKVYYLAPNFRYEKPQAGRLRQHHQFGVECFGPEGPEADAEVIALGASYLATAGVGRIKLHLNTIGCPDCRPAYNAALKAYFEGRRAELCGTCLDRLERNPMRILDCKVESCRAVAAEAPKIAEHLCAGCAEHFESLKALLAATGIAFEEDPHLVRGFDYYTRTVFEFISDTLGTAVLAGGRYDGLVAELGGQPTPGLGFGSGIERLLLCLEAEGAADAPRPAPDIFFALAERAPELDAAVQALTLSLRDSGLWAERDLMGRSLKAQMKFAAKLGARVAGVIGGEELAAGRFKARDMEDGGEESWALDAGEIAAKLKEKRDGGK